MNNRAFNVDMDAFVIHANSLEKMHRAAFPNAVRSTLNSLAFDVKTRSMPQSAEKAFTQRKKNFFRANSSVEMARGFRVDSMASIVGFVSTGKNQAVEDLEQQEHGGTIDGRAFVPANEARVTRSSKKLISKRHRISEIKNVINVSSQKGTTEKQQFFNAALKAGKGGYVLTKRSLILVRNVRPNARPKMFDLVGLYRYKKGRSVKIRHATRFMEKATKNSVRNTEKIYINHAEKQFEKFGK